MKYNCSKKESFDDLNQTIKFLKIVSEENRLKILCLLQKGEKCVCEIWQALNLPQNLISHHLKILKDYKLVSSRQEGVKIFYQLNQKFISKNLKLLNKFLKLKGGEKL